MTYQERVEAFKKLHPDFEARMRHSAGVPLAQEIYEIIFTLENGPQVAYFLACNHEFAVSLLKMRVHFAALEIGKMAAQLAEFS
jgi:hypothetical protein